MIVHNCGKRSCAAGRNRSCWVDSCYRQGLASRCTRKSGSRTCKDCLNRMATNRKRAVKRCGAGTGQLCRSKESGSRTRCGICVAEVNQTGMNWPRSSLHGRGESYRVRDATLLDDSAKTVVVEADGLANADTKEKTEIVASSRRLNRKAFPLFCDGVIDGIFVTAVVEVIDFMPGLLQR